MVHFGYTLRYTQTRIHGSLRIRAAWVQSRRARSVVLAEKAADTGGDDGRRRAA
ncbi:hypothetical protein [Pengzhenrongella sp.]|uniref:hypothetical protein n=1 Tax=Pengzhenrongella sp. TaxID=2888820 RepID=UPI002F93FED4